MLSDTLNVQAKGKGKVSDVNPWMNQRESEDTGGDDLSVSTGALKTKLVGRSCTAEEYRMNCKCRCVDVG